MQKDIKSLPGGTAIALVIGAAVAGIVILFDAILELGILGVVGLAVLALLGGFATALRYRHGRPAFVITATGVQLSILREEIAWAEIRTIKEAGHDLEWLRFEIEVHDEKAIVERAHTIHRRLTAASRRLGRLPRRLALWDSDSRLRIDELEAELNRRSGRQIVERRQWRTSLASQLLRHLVYAGQRPRRARGADHGRG